MLYKYIQCSVRINRITDYLIVRISMIDRRRRRVNTFIVFPRAQAPKTKKKKRKTSRENGSKKEIT